MTHLSLEVGLIIIGVSLPSADLAVCRREDGLEFSAAEKRFLDRLRCMNNRVANISISGFPDFP